MGLFRITPDVTGSAIPVYIQIHDHLGLRHSNCPKYSRKISMRAYLHNVNRQRTQIRSI